LYTEGNVSPHTNTFSLAKTFISKHSNVCSSLERKHKKKKERINKTTEHVASVKLTWQEEHWMSILSSAAIFCKTTTTKTTKNKMSVMADAQLLESLQ
jgi:hypothetical protein